MSSLLGEGYVLCRRVLGLSPACPDGGGGRERGVVAPQNPGHLPWATSPCSLLMIRVGRPWNLLLLLVGPGPPGSF
jgi:hypothetical protein